MTAVEIRNKFTDYFVKNGHKLVPSSSLIPEGDPSVLLTTAGMQQFKKYMMGDAQPPAPRLTSVQKCFRTSDIDEVGDDSHLTFFEMLGNFSIGDYFKEEAIRFAWELITKEFGLKKEQLFVTIFKGDESVPRDDEAAAIWQKVAGSDIEIQEFGREDNFWGPTGDEGPCGPCSEIHVTLQNGKALEIWNLVFMEFYQHKDGKLEPLKRKNIDTGMGLERIVLVLQDVDTIYNADLFAPIILETRKSFAVSAADEHELLFERVLADHLRAATFLIADGITPSNTERGYILRRLIRRCQAQAIRLHKDPKRFGTIINVIIDQYKAYYPDLEEKGEHILMVVLHEVEKYQKTLRQGIAEFEKMARRLEAGGQLSGKDAFKLHDTYGLPLDLTVILAKEKQLGVDLEGFEQALGEQKERSRSHRDESKEAYNPALIAPVHTAAHLLNAALMKVLGDGVAQAGQKLTPGRVRHDITFDRKITAEELKRTEDFINQKVKENLPVTMVESTYEQAKKEGAQALFYETYQAKQKVTRCKINSFSDELCGGPHVAVTSAIGRVTIEKEESAGQGKRRIYARVER